MITYELALKLKEAGFKQQGAGLLSTTDDFKILSADPDGTYKIPREGIVYIPTLSELIEAIGSTFHYLTRNIDDSGWEAHFYDIEDSTRQVSGKGSTPEEAVSALWLSLNKKDA